MNLLDFSNSYMSRSSKPVLNNTWILFYQIHKTRKYSEEHNITLLYHHILTIMTLDLLILLYLILLYLILLYLILLYLILFYIILIDM